MVYLVYLVCLVCFVGLVDLVVWLIFDSKIAKRKIIMCNVLK